MSYKFKRAFVWMPVLLCAAWLVAACAVQPVTPQPAPQVPAPTAPSDSTAAAQMQATVDALRGQVAAQLQISPDAVEVVAVEAVEWPDACLGAAGPDEMCAQVITPGYKITLAVAGQEYVYHTDAGPYWLRLVAGPAADVGEPVIRWQGAVDNGSCQAAVIGAGGVAYGYCGGAQFPGKFVSPARAAALNEFAARYAAFSAVTDWGEIAFTGIGPQVATPAEQTQLASWAQRLVMEAASGAALGGMAWSGPEEMGSDDTAKCATLQMSGGEATVWDCAGNFETVKLNGGYLTRWLALQDQLRILRGGDADRDADLRRHGRRGGRGLAAGAAGLGADAIRRTEQRADERGRQHRVGLGPGADQRHGNQLHAPDGAGLGRSLRRTARLCRGRGRAGRDDGLADHGRDGAACGLDDRLCAAVR